MRYRLLGKTGMHVSELCLGTMTFGGKGFWEVMGGLRQDAVNLLVKIAFDEGINFIDTANVYSLGESETLLGNAIRTLGLPREQLVIATKAYGKMTELPNGAGLSRYHLMQQVDKSLARLGLDHIDLYQVHGTDPVTPLEETLDALNDIVRSGKVRYVGLCNMAAWNIMKGLGISERRGWAKFSSVQAFYTVASRDLEREVVPLLKDQGLGLMVWSPLAGGLLSGKYRPDGKGPEGARRTTFDFPVVNKERAFRCVEVMRGIAGEHGVSVAQVALAWLLAQDVVSSVILGARNETQLRDNLASTKLRLSEGEKKALEEASRLEPEYPGWMIDYQGQYRKLAPEFPPADK
jgi:aryl-alcohol dehydrogenase-like predicted oxidoreductase